MFLRNIFFYYFFILWMEIWHQQLSSRPSKSLCTPISAASHTQMPASPLGVDLGESIIIWWKVFIFSQKKCAWKIKISVFTCLSLYVIMPPYIHWPYAIPGATWANLCYHVKTAHQHTIQRQRKTFHLYKPIHYFFCIFGFLWLTA